MVNNFKSLLSKLFIAKKQNKIKVKIYLEKKDICLLDFLWIQGFIYGYTKIDLKVYCIFLKPNVDNFMFQDLIFLKGYVNVHKLKSLSYREKNKIFIVKTLKGVFSNKVCIKKGLGGYLLACI